MIRSSITALAIFATALAGSKAAAEDTFEIGGRMSITYDDGSGAGPQPVDPEFLETMQMRIGPYVPGGYSIHNNEAYGVPRGRGSYRIEVTNKYSGKMTAKLLFDENTVQLMASEGSKQWKTPRKDEIGDDDPSRILYLESGIYDPYPADGWDYATLAHNYPLTFSIDKKTFTDTTGYADLLGIITLWDKVIQARNFLYSNRLGPPRIVLQGVSKEGRTGYSNPLYRVSDRTIYFNAAMNSPRSDNRILHEYGHAVFHARFGDYAYLSNSFCGGRGKPGTPNYKLGHVLGTPVDRQCAFLEGWANFYSLAMSNILRFGPEGVYEAARRYFDFNSAYKKDGYFDFETGYPFSTVDPKDEAYVTAVLWRIHQYGGVPIAAFLEAVTALRTSNVPAEELSLSKYLPRLRCAAATVKQVDPRERLTNWTFLLGQTWSPEDYLEPFPRAQRYWPAAGQCQSENDTGPQCKDGWCTQ